MRANSIVVLTVLTLAAPLAACQSPQESAMSAENTCANQGLTPGSSRFRRCVDATYAANRAQSQQAANETAVGVGAAIIGGAVLGAALDDDGGYYHHHRHWRRHRHHHW